MESKYPVMSKMYEVNTTRNRNMFFLTLTIFLMLISLNIGCFLIMAYDPDIKHHH